MKSEIVNAFFEKVNGKIPVEMLSRVIFLLEETLDQLEDEKCMQRTNEDLLNLFTKAKRLEGCSERTIKYYGYILTSLIVKEEKHVFSYDSDQLREILNQYQKKNNASKTSVDNVRRVFSSFFSWLEEENYIIKSPCRRIHKIRSVKSIKEVYNDETVEMLRNCCTNVRNLAIVDLLSSSGIRVGELVNLNIGDIDLENKECIVFGKGGKERRAYFDSKTKLHIRNYLKGRIDNNEALFVSMSSPKKRLQISGIEILLRKMGRQLNISKVHPHRFRRTLATSAIDKGMPIEQVQKLLGHAKIDTTMIYAMVDQNNVKNSYRKFLG